ncbi:MAG: rod shape-determining protein MreD [bacterium]
MKNSSLSLILISFALVLFQVLLLSKFHVLGLINPFVYLYIILIMPVNVGRVPMLFIGFTLGLLIDMFSNTWGIHALVTTFITYLRPSLILMIIGSDEQDRVTLSARSMGRNFWKLAAIIFFIHHTLLFFVEAFSFQTFWFVLAKSIISTILSLLIVYVFEKIRN